MACAYSHMINGFFGWGFFVAYSSILAGDGYMGLSISVLNSVAKVL